MAVGYVREARPGDADEIARIQLTTWRIAYRRILPVRALDELDQGWLAGRWRDAVMAPPGPTHRVLVGVEQHDRSVPGELVGFVAAGPADAHAAAPQEPDPPRPEEAAAITDLLVCPRWGRRGHGSRLLAACVDRWREDGFTTAVAWVYEADPATNRFLASAGWEPDGARRALDVDDRLVPQVRLHTRLPD